MSSTRKKVAGAPARLTSSILAFQFSKVILGVSTMIILARSSAGGRSVLPAHSTICL